MYNHLFLATLFVSPILCGLPSVAITLIRPTKQVFDSPGKCDGLLPGVYSGKNLEENRSKPREEEVFPAPSTRTRTPDPLHH